MPLANQQLLNEARAFLLKFKKEGITSELLDNYLIPLHHKPNDFNVIYKRLCISAQNKTMVPNVIGKTFDGLGQVLYDFDPINVANYYHKTDGNELLHEIIKQLNPIGKDITNPKGIWSNFTRTVIEGAYFLKQFNEPYNFYKWADSFAENYEIKLKLPLLISNQIHGIGFALACDFIKEIGYTQYGKPDTHIINIFKGIGKIDNTNQKKSTEDTFLAYFIIDEIAKDCNNTSYAVDKLLWLIGSGTFYKDEINIGRQADFFVTRINNLKPSKEETKF